MRVFVYEHVTGGGCLGGPMIASLAAEGDMMLRALVSDLLQLPGVEVLICRDARMPELRLPVEVCSVSEGEDPLALFDACLQSADAVWPVAPECEDILERLSRRVLAGGKRLLNSRPHAVRVCASKLLTADYLRQSGLPVVDTWPLGERPMPADGQWVIKPDKGVGCVDTRLFTGTRRGEPELDAMQDWVMQPYVEGRAASLSLLVGDHQCWLLGSNLQRMAVMDDRFVLLGCVVNGLSGERSGLMRLADEIVQAIPGLWGHVGVDLVLADEGPLVLEINPRLTTSYVGLSESLGCNVAGMVLELLGGQAIDRPVPPVLHHVDVDLELCHVA